MPKATLLASASAALLIAAGFTAGPALAKRTAPARSGIVVTQQDVRTCIGVNGSSAAEQIIACTKIINSGKIHHPHEGDYYATRGAAYYATKQFDTALADYNKALSFEQKGEFYFQRALILMAMSEVEKAKADFAEVVKLRPDFAPTYFMRGLISYQAADYKAAIEDFDIAVRRNPTYYQAIFARGAAKTRLGDDSGGNDDLKQARGIGAHVDDDMKTFGVVP